MRIVGSIDGVNKVVRNLEQRHRAVTQVATQAVATLADDLLTTANKRTPVVTGALRASGNVFIDAVGPNKVATISYGTSLQNPDGVPTSEYAVQRHEELNPKKPEAHKWLEISLLDISGNYTGELGAIIARALYGGGR